MLYRWLDAPTNGGFIAGFRRGAGNLPMDGTIVGEGIVGIVVVWVLGEF